MGIWFILILLIIFVLLRAALILFKKEIFKAIPEQYVKLLFNGYPWAIAITVLITALLFFYPDTWVEYVINNVIPKALLFKNQTGLDEGAGARGDAFGGTYAPLIGWFAAIITFAAFWVQYIANEQQKRVNEQQHNDLQIERFENRFFKFIDYHRENVTTMKYRDPKTKEIRYWQGNQVFTVIYYEIKDLLDDYMRNKPVRNNFDITTKANAIDFVYQCVFFGCGVHSLPILEEKFDDSEFENIYFIDRLATYSTPLKRNVYYSGHIRRLGHYFRNLYQAVKYVDEQTFLTEKQKYEYVTILRAQMSVYEQAVFFYNSLSELGKVWEWDRYRGAYPNNEIKKKEVFKTLWITKYDFIRNTLNNDGVVSSGININHFYPLINLERENEFEQVGALPFNNNLDKQKNICRFCFNKTHIGYYSDKEELAKAENEIKAVYRKFPRSLLCSLKSDCETNKITNTLPIQK